MQQKEELDRRVAVQCMLFLEKARHLHAVPRAGSCAREGRRRGCSADESKREDRIGATAEQRGLVAEEQAV